MNDSHMQFRVNAFDGNARSGLMAFQRGEVATPAFMPVGTYGSVKGLNPQQILDTGTEIILGNAFHLMARPGSETILKHRGLHDYIGRKKTYTIFFILGMLPIGFNYLTIIYGIPYIIFFLVGYMVWSIQIDLKEKNPPLKATI